MSHAAPLPGRAQPEKDTELSPLGTRSIRAARQRLAQKPAGHYQVVSELPKLLPVTEAEQRLIAIFLTDIFSDILSEPS